MYVEDLRTIVTEITLLNSMSEFQWNLDTDSDRDSVCLSTTLVKRQGRVLLMKLLAQNRKWPGEESKFTVALVVKEREIETWFPGLASDQPFPREAVVTASNLLRSALPNTMLPKEECECHSTSEQS
jgi:hypothetical protein